MADSTLSALALGAGTLLGGSVTAWFTGRGNRQTRAVETNATLAAAGITDNREELEALRKRIDALERTVGELMRERADLVVDRGALRVANEALLQRVVLADAERDAYAARCLGLETSLEEHGGRPSQVQPHVHLIQRYPTGAAAVRAPTLPPAFPLPPRKDSL